MTVRLVLPYPVSANRYWATVARGKRAITYVTEDAKVFKRECAWIAKQAGCTNPSSRPIELTVMLVPRNGVCMDLDNALKVTIDALKGIAYVDDSQVWKINAQRSEPDPAGAKTLVEVSEFIPMVSPLFADATAAR